MLSVRVYNAAQPAREAARELASVEKGEFVAELRFLQRDVLEYLVRRELRRGVESFEKVFVTLFGFAEELQFATIMERNVVRSVHRMQSEQLLRNFELLFQRGESEEGSEFGRVQNKIKVSEQFSLHSDYANFLLVVDQPGCYYLDVDVSVPRSANIVDYLDRKFARLLLLRELHEQTIEYLHPDAQHKNYLLQYPDLIELKCYYDEITVVFQKDWEADGEKTFKLIRYLLDRRAVRKIEIVYSHLSDDTWKIQEIDQLFVKLIFYYKDTTSESLVKSIQVQENLTMVLEKRRLSVRFNIVGKVSRFLEDGIQVLITTLNNCKLIDYLDVDLVSDISHSDDEEQVSVFAFLNFVLGYKEFIKNVLVSFQGLDQFRLNKGSTYLSTTYDFESLIGNYGIQFHSLYEVTINIRQQNRYSFLVQEEMNDMFVFLELINPHWTRIRILTDDEFNFQRSFGYTRSGTDNVLRMVERFRLLLGLYFHKLEQNRSSSPKIDNFYRKLAHKHRVLHLLRALQHGLKSLKLRKGILKEISDFLL